MTCSVEGCERDAQVKTMCSTCYQRQRRTGTVQRTTRRSADVLEDVEFLLAHGVHAEMICQRLGMTPGAICAALRRQDRGDLSIPFSALAKARKATVA